MRWSKVTPPMVLAAAVTFVLVSAVSAADTNVAPLGTATQSSTCYNMPPERAIDGNLADDGSLGVEDADGLVPGDDDRLVRADGECLNLLKAGLETAIGPVAKVCGIGFLELAEIDLGEALVELGGRTGGFKAAGAVEFLEKPAQDAPGADKSGAHEGSSAKAGFPAHRLVLIQQSICRRIGMR